MFHAKIVKIYFRDGSSIAFCTFFSVVYKVTSYTYYTCNSGYRARDFFPNLMPFWDGYNLLHLVSWGSEVTPSATPFFKRAYKISHPPGLWAFWDALPSFASSAQSVKIGLSKWIFYVKNHPNLSEFFFHWRIIG